MGVGLSELASGGLLWRSPAIQMAHTPSSALMFCTAGLPRHSGTSYFLFIQPSAILPHLEALPPLSSAF